MKENRRYWSKVSYIPAILMVTVRLLEKTNRRVNDGRNRRNKQ